MFLLLIRLPALYSPVLSVRDKEQLVKISKGFQFCFQPVKKLLYPSLSLLNEDMNQKQVSFNSQQLSVKECTTLQPDIELLWMPNEILYQKKLWSLHLLNVHMKFIIITIDIHFHVCDMLIEIDVFLDF